MKKGFIILLASLSFMYGCGEKKSAETTVSENQNADGTILLSHQQFENSGMTLGSLEEKSFPLTIQINGMIDVPPENRAVVSATMGGYIKKTPLLIGDVVKKGQALVTLENPEFVTLQQEYMEIKQQLTYLKAEYDRQKTLKEENITSQKSFLKAESDFKTSNARYNGLKKQLTMLNISPVHVEQGNISSTASVFAPIGGSITQVNVNKGTYVSPASPILEIIDNDHIHLELSVFEKDIMKVKKGQPIQFRIPEASKEIFLAEVYLIGTSINENRTIKVHGHLKEESENNFLTGMFVNAEIITENKSAKALPSDAVVEQDGEFYVLRMLENTSGGYSFESIEIQPGNVANGFTEIKNADSLSTSDSFLTKGAFDVFGE
ncbi:efflux RND transporter periplasmic adaptor subunit [Maribacter algarum]|uniref:Efflux RND transporter periplasmic adaptor subunit n=1 Tax=Maribacter algarum (ex Zhang et al. 2020) TaxID=2578118 RepID=A0A5S3PWS4_9FLAO|nr:efflux RND transporter periplasmic adaptor subunit [Maribacter algarum]TMM58682.1 efflux RND transporter periplasmic adaptor subunit [Maribacter algarum]